MRHLLVTNDFPPKVGGIQSYLWELWRRLPPESFAVYTTPHDGDEAFDAAQPFEVRRSREPVLLPHPLQARTVNKLAADVDADFVVLDPALPLGAIGPRLDLPYAVVLHGAEVTVPGRLPVSRQLLGNVLRNAAHVITAGGYPAAEGEHAAGRSLASTNVPPGVDTDRFRPLEAGERRAVRERYGLDADAPLVVSVSRLVPRKGMDVLIEASTRLAENFGDIQVAIAGSGRDQKRLAADISRHNAPVRLLGRVPEADLPKIYGCGDVFAMLCRNRWGGLEQEGFGIVFLEAAAAGVPQVAGASGGAAEAVEHGVTGLVVQDPRDPDEAATAIATLLADDAVRADYAERGRSRAEQAFSYDHLADRLAAALSTVRPR